MKNEVIRAAIRQFFLFWTLNNKLRWNVTWFQFLTNQLQGIIIFTQCWHNLKTNQVVYICKQNTRRLTKTQLPDSVETLGWNFESWLTLLDLINVKSCRSQNNSYRFHSFYKQYIKVKISICLLTVASKELDELCTKYHSAEVFQLEQWWKYFFAKMSIPGPSI